MSDKHKQDIYQLLWQMFNMTGGLTEVKQLEQLRKLSLKFSTAIGQQAKDEAIELMRKLQKAVVDGFEKTFKAVGDLEKRISELEKVNATKPCRCDKRSDSSDVQSDSGEKATD